jgi:hypothetical protein
MALQPGLTCQQIITLACQEAKGPGYTLQAGQYLNLVLQELAQNHKLSSNQGWFTFNFLISPLVPTVNSGNVVAGSGPYALPNDFLRVDFGDFFWQLGGINYFPTPLDQDQFDALIQQPGFTSYPTAYWVDVSTSPAGLYIWPAASGAYQAFMRYRRQTADIVTPEISATVPWFQSQMYLLRRLSAEIMALTGDDRREQTLFDAARILSQYLAYESDSGTRSVTVKKDPRRFGPRWGSMPPTKEIPW